MAAEQGTRVLWGHGAYSVSEICRILQPSMTPRKVHYWLDTGLLSEPLVRGRRGVPTLLTFRQLIEIRTVQRLRDELRFKLEDVRSAVTYIIGRTLDGDWTEARFSKGAAPGGVVVLFDDEAVDITTHQLVIQDALPELTQDLYDARAAWSEQQLTIRGHPHIVSNVRVNAGAPVIRGTRIETSLVALFANDKTYDESVVTELRRTYPRTARDGLIDALEFEGCRAA